MMSNLQIPKTRSSKKLLDAESLLKSDNITNKDIVKLMYNLHNMLDAKIDQFSVSMKTLEAQVNSNKENIEKISSTCETNVNNINDLISRVNFLEQQEFCSDIVISGLFNNIPEPDKIVQIIFKLLQVQIIDLQFISKRTYSSKKNTTFEVIICRFIKLESKINFMKKLRQRGPIFTKEVFQEAKSATSKIFINERLTPHYFKLLKFCRESLKAGLINKCYYSNRQIFIKTHENSEAISIRSREQFDKIISIQKIDDHGPGNNSENSDESFSTTIITSNNNNS